MRGKVEDRLIVNEKHSLPKREGNGHLVRKIWVNAQDEIVKYSLVYINENITLKDNSRVLGYDNSHGHHHKHRMGVESSIKFDSFEDMEAQFLQEFEEIHNENAQDE